MSGRQPCFEHGTSSFWKENQIELYTLYPNFIPIIQPLDTSVFHPLEELYAKPLREWRIDNNIIDMSKEMFSKVLKLTLDKIDLSESIRNGFRSCGLHPFDPNAPEYNILNKTKAKKQRE